MIRGITLRLQSRAVAIFALIIFAVIGSVVVPATLGQTNSAAAAVWPEYKIDMSKFNAGAIITDPLFFDGAAMSASQVQTFLNEKVPSCRSGYTCLKSKKVDTTSIPANPMCKAYQGAKAESAATIIYKVGVACGISQKVILVTLQKEQGLVTDTWPSERQYTYAMGADCPDSGDGCGATAGFFKQVYRGVYQFKRYTGPPGTGPGTPYDFPFVNMKKAYTTVNVQYSTATSCGTKRVYIANQATHVLYVYTPYTPNSGALNAGWGTASCGAYGNRNFFRYYFQWFGDPNGVPPKMETAPDQSGDVAGQETVGQTLTVSAGKWTGNPAPSTRYQWYSCGAPVSKVASSVPGDCAAIAAATTTRYTLTSADVGRYIAPAVTLTNQSGSASRITPTTAFVYSPPSNTAAPVITGVAVASQPITVNPGTWSGAPAPSFTYSWSICPTPNVNSKKCVRIKGPSSASIKPKKTDVGKYYVARVTATNRSSAAAITPTAILVMSKPSVKTHAAISGAPLIGSMVTATTGKWSATPAPSYTYEFLACDSVIKKATTATPGSCIVFAPAQSSASVLVPAAIAGNYIAARVTATNGGGSSVSVTASTKSKVSADPALPTVSGDPTVGQTLTATSGAWLGKLLKPVLATNGAKYAGRSIFGIQDALRAAGYGTPRTGKYDPRTIADVKKFQKANKLSTPDGLVGPATWAKLQAVRTRAVVSVSYQWVSCTAQVTARLTAQPAECSDIPGAINPTYTVVSADIGKYLSVRVSATDSADQPPIRWALTSSAAH